MSHFSSDHQRKQLTVIHDIEREVQGNTTNFSLVSPVQDYEHDERICLTSIHFPHHSLIQKIQSEIITPLQQRFPEHYYYQDASLHLTIKNIRVINDPPRYNQQDVEKVKKVFDRTIPQHHAFHVYFYRLFLFPSNLALFGTTDPELDSIHLDLNHKLSEDGIPDDKQYLNKKYFFSNMTLARFTKPITQDFTDEVLKISSALQFDPYLVNSVSLVSGNAVMKKLKIHKEWNLP